MCLGERVASEHTYFKSFSILIVPVTLAKQVQSHRILGHSRPTAILPSAHFIWWDHKEADTKTWVLWAFHLDRTKGNWYKTLLLYTLPGRFLCCQHMSVGLSDSVAPSQLFSLSQLFESKRTIDHSQKTLKCNQQVRKRCMKWSKKEKKKWAFIWGGKEHCLFTLV